MVHKPGRSVDVVEDLARKMEDAPSLHLHGDNGPSIDNLGVVVAGVLGELLLELLRGGVMGEVVAIVPAALELV
jgi:hypothetical protein